MTLSEPIYAEAAAPIHIGSATVAGHKAVARVFADAFQDDPIFAWAIPDAERRQAILPDVFEVFVWAYSRHNETYLASAGTEPLGATLWAPAGVAPIAEEDEEEFIARLDAIVGPDTERFHQIMELLEAHHPTDDVQYLQFFGVVADAQGRGIGSRLLKEMTDRCDEAGIAMYHEATSLRNKALYERHGYVCVEEISVADSPPLWCMWRAPR